MKYVFLLLLSGLLVTAPGFAQNGTANPTGSQGYLLGPGDEITGKVLGEPQFDFVATIDEDGKIEVPFFDQPVIAKCKTERELRADITQLLARYLRNPQASIRVTERNSRPKVTITGEVRQPQQIDLTRRAHLLELISFAGNETDKSSGIIQVFRTRAPLCSEEEMNGGNDSGFFSVKTYSLTSMQSGIETANPEIFPGDVIVLQKASPVYVTGEVEKPGEYSIPEQGLPLMQAIAMANGMTRDAKRKSVNIYRRKEGSVEPEVITVNYRAIASGDAKEILLQPNDIVEVGKGRKSAWDILYEAALGVPSRMPLPVRSY